MICSHHKCDGCHIVDYLQYQIDKKKDEIRQQSEYSKKRYVQFI